VAKLPPQATPAAYADLSVEEGEADEPIVTFPLGSGITVRLRPPDLFATLATVEAVPSQMMMDVLNLLDQEGTIIDYLPAPEKFLRIRNKTRGMYQLAAYLIVSPRLILAPARPRRRAGEFGENQISLNEVEFLYYRYFRNQYRGAPLVLTAPEQPDAAQEPASAGGDVLPIAA
jgi:hypothetical protein